MLYKAPSRRDRFRTVRPLLDFVAGLHAANGLAHGVRPAPHSPARNRAAR
ncbi:hypothetical protein AB0K11_22475 [Mycobacterium sp. NPDC050551]